MILCIDGMMKPSITDVSKVSVSMYNCNIKSGSVSPLPAVQDQLSLRSAIFDPYAVPKWLPWVYMHEVL